MKHELKTIQPYFDRVWNNEKLFEVRNNDRDFQAGDTVLLKEYDAETKVYSGKKIYATITYVLKNYPSIKEGFCVFSFYINEWFEDKK